jgi:hypothetical protein
MASQRRPRARRPRAALSGPSRAARRRAHTPRPFSNTSGAILRIQAAPPPPSERRRARARHSSRCRWREAERLDAFGHDRELCHVPRRSEALQIEGGLVARVRLIAGVAERARGDTVDPCVVDGEEERLEAGALDIVQLVRELRLVTLHNCAYSDLAQLLA